MSELHYVITVQWNAPNGSLNVATDSGVIPAEGRTRAQLFAAITARTATRIGAPLERTSLLFFILEPNREWAA